MLNSFTVQRYKAFVERTRIELRPLTLLFGYNNAGKSALLRTLPLLADSILDTGRSPLKRGIASRDGAFEDLVSRLEPARGLAFELAWTDETTFRVEIKDLPEWHRQVVMDLELTRQGRTVHSRWIPREDPTTGLPDRWYEVTEGDKKREVRLEMAGLMPTLDSEGEDPEKWGSLFNDLQNKLREIADGLQWLASLRVAPTRSFKPGDAPPERLAPDGRDVADLLFFDRIDRGGLIREVSTWFEQHFEQILDLHEVGDSAYLSLSPLAAAGLRVPLADTGEGMAQVLPVLVALALARRATPDEPRILALEQPELHLHPAAESALAQLFTETVVGAPSTTLLVETHSENMMLSVQLQVAEGKIPPEAVAIYWVERLFDGRAMVRSVEIDSKGYAHGWPHGVFSEDTELARRLYLLRQEQRAS